MMAHRERKAFFDRGLAPSNSAYRMPSGPGPMTMQADSPRDCGTSEALLRRGLITAFVGLALLIGLSFIGYEGDGNWRPGPWLLGGLIPLFIGMAQILTARLSSGATSMAGWRVQPPPAFERPVHAVPDPSQPYAYRPAGDQTELPRPPNPP